MQKTKQPDGYENNASQNPLEQKVTYQIDGRSFVVQPVFKKEGTNTLGAALLRIMQADCENKE